jgi:hypothetical protein
MIRSGQNGLMVSLNANVRLNLGFSFLNGQTLSLKRNRVTDMVMEAFKANSILAGSIISGTLEKKDVRLVLERIENDALILKAE